MRATTTLTKPNRRRLSARVRLNKRISRRPQIHNILVPIDFSPASLDVIEFARPWLKLFGAELYLVHVVPPDYPLSTLADLAMIAPDLEISRRVREYLNNAAKKYGVAVASKNIHSLKGRPFEQICRLTRNTNIDLIVISTRGHTGFKHLALGSTAERVVRFSPCPVLVMRSAHPAGNRNGNGNPQHAALHVRKILVPVDFSDCSRHGVEYAKRLAKEFHATLVLLHSVYFQYQVTAEEFARYDYPLLVQEADKAAHQQMRELVSATESDGIMVEPLVEMGHAGEQICERARSHGADLIVTATHGWTGFKHVLLGSTAEYVVQHARCPVLVVPTHNRPGVTSTKAQI